MTLATLISKRIAIVRQYKSENPDSNFPADRDLDAEVPGSGELIDRLGAIIERLQRVKDRQGGRVGIWYCKHHRSYAARIGNGRPVYGFRTALAAAAAYNRHARRVYGDDAVLNDLDAVEAYGLDIRDKQNRTV
jgi:hypothetical protein